MKSRKAIRVVIGMVRRLCPEFLPLLTIQKMINTSIPYINIVFSSRIIDAMLQKQEFEIIFREVLWMISLNCILNILGWGLDKLVNVRKYVLADQVQKMISEKALVMDYELLEKKETLEYIEKARAGMDGNGDIGAFCSGLAGMVGIISDIIYSLILLVPLFLPVNDVNKTGMNQILRSPWSGIILGFILIAQLVILYWSSKRQAQAQQEGFEVNVDGNRKMGYFLSFMNNYSKGKDLRMYQIGETIMENYEKGISELVDNFWIINKQMGKYSIINEICSGIFAIASYVYVGLKAWSGVVSVGNVVKYVSTFTKFSFALGGVVNTYAGISFQARYLAYFVEFMNIENKKYKGTLPIEKRDDNEYEFEFRDVSFWYPNSEVPVLDHVSLKLKIGRKLAVVGPNGAGKSTFIKLLCRLYDPTEGEILLNGIDIRYYDYEEYIKLFSVVFQDFKLFSFSIAENVAVSKEFDEEKVRKCLKKAGFSERLGTLEKDIYTNLYQLEEDGVEISGGEAQKIAIARALYKDSPLVILDEPTSALDPVSEYEIYKSFNELVEDKTAIYISHRMSSCRFCNNIIVFEQGKIVEQGSHEELLEHEGGLYHEMWNSQAKYYQ